MVYTPHTAVQWYQVVRAQRAVKSFGRVVAVAFSKTWKPETGMCSSTRQHMHTTPMDLSTQYNTSQLLYIYPRIIPYFQANIRIVSDVPLE